jgi:DNA-binding MarR family transcriptional regulator
MNAEIMRFCRVFMRNAGDDMSIRASQFAVLSIMCTTPGLHVPAILAETLHVSKAMISAHLAVLIEHGLVVRVPSPEDGRSVYVMPSKRGVICLIKFHRQIMKK